MSAAPPIYGLAWRVIGCQHQARSSHPFAATREEAATVCQRMNAEWPTLHHWPARFDGPATN